LMLVLLASASIVVYAATSSTALTSKDSGSSETELGDLVADAIRGSLKTDIAFITASELKETTVAKGDVSAADIADAITYQSDPIVILTLKGDQIRKALERSVIIYPQKNLGFLQVSGLKFSFDPSRPKESRVTSITVGGRALDPEAAYSVGATSSLANGALGYFRVWGKDQITSVTKTSLVQAVETYLQANPKLDYRRDRISILK
jgi:5'-nucleotidase / UDP-sugar diphosphatase